MKKDYLLLFMLLSTCYSVAAQESAEDYPWLDTMHQSIASSVNSSALWFDDFFALEDFDDREEAYGEARIRLGWEPRSRDLSKFEMRFKVRVKLPNLKHELVD